MNQLKYLFCTPFFLLMLLPGKRETDAWKPISSYAGLLINVTVEKNQQVNLQNTRIILSNNTFNVKANGQAWIPEKPAGREIAYLQDNQNNLLLMGFISEEEREISLRSTAEVLLSLNMINFGFDSTAPFEEQLICVKSRLHQLFLKDPQMLQKGLYKKGNQNAGNILKIFSN